ncbi:4'-phosphopantetheinyl transferase family protein [Kitasatospora cheerisanensis]|uniref:Putative phosphopantetheinyl transferase n=1 Tax=Kitasatospora cheerisanensis KCTC 2395 TaxID=1348663 RepID=A0A066Z0M1_9ACTN|nr:4'-phosphopantetheinyl transferase superfamily protein [Kitasatospora cheerisanensis]KDN85789.1 putative phosphopantetheinyl transferase [Kitasatospora cheerisanensis KCTC 2395]
MSHHPLALLATTAEVLARPDADERLLSDVERERADRFRRPSDRDDYLAAHLLVRYCAAAHLGIDPAEVAFGQQCPGCGRTGHGRPLLTDRPGTHLSLSHTGGIIAAAAGPVPVGVDVEHLGARANDPAALGHVLTPAETELIRSHPDPTRAFLRQWVRKEAMIKLGRATLDTLPQLDLSALPLDPPVRHRHGDLHYLELTTPDAVFTAAATLPPELGEL